MRRFGFWLCLVAAIGGIGLTACSTTVGGEDGKRFSFLESATEGAQATGATLTNAGTSTGNPLLLIAGQVATLLGAVGAAVLADRRQDRKAYTKEDVESIDAARNGGSKPVA